MESRKILSVEIMWILFIVNTAESCLLLAGPKAQPTSVRHQIRILDIFATFYALFEKMLNRILSILEVFATFYALFQFLKGS